MKTFVSLVILGLFLTAAAFAAVLIAMANRIPLASAYAGMALMMQGFRFRKTSQRPSRPVIRKPGDKPERMTCWRFSMASGDQFFYHAPMHVRQPEVTAGVAVG
jgi:hypothetical protein